LPPTCSGTTPITTLGELLPIPWSTGPWRSDAIGLISLLPALFDMDNLALAPSPLEVRGGRSPRRHDESASLVESRFQDAPILGRRFVV
jgi:hypothetical protein